MDSRLQDDKMDALIESLRALPDIAREASERPCEDFRVLEHRVSTLEKTMERTSTTLESVHAAVTNLTISDSMREKREAANRWLIGLALPVIMGVVSAAINYVINHK